MKTLKFSLALTALIGSGVFAKDITLYADKTTGQLFATPGENRVLLGEFTQKSKPQELEPAKQIVPKVMPIEDVAQAKPVVKSEELALEDLDVDIQEGRPEGLLGELKPHWADKIKLKGYMQFRKSFFLDAPEQDYTLWSDKSVNQGNDGFLIRRARLIVAGNVGDHLGVYIQPDFASEEKNLGQLRDFYGDIYIDKSKEHRVRVGQSKIPFGFENMQSSSKRFALDRNDAINSAARDERDVGAFYYYTPEHVQALFREIDAKRLRGSGNYGMFGLGVYNGQGANKPELNDNLHTISRLTYPFKLQSGQFMEFGVQGYMGKYKPFNGDETVLDTVGASGIDDGRFGVSAMIYPQPFGLQAEWNWGVTPGFDEASQSIAQKSLNGGYVQAMYMWDDLLKGGDTFTAFVKWQYFDGYSKAEQNAPRNEVDDWEIGTEWYVAPELRIQTILHLMNRQDLTLKDPQAPYFGERFEGSVFRVQTQVNY